MKTMHLEIECLFKNVEYEKFCVNPAKRNRNISSSYLKKNLVLIGLVSIAIPAIILFLAQYLSAQYWLLKIY